MKNILKNDYQDDFDSTKINTIVKEFKDESIPLVKTWCEITSNLSRSLDREHLFLFINEEDLPAQIEFYKTYMTPGRYYDYNTLSGNRDGSEIFVHINHLNLPVLKAIGEPPFYYSIIKVLNSV